MNFLITFHKKNTQYIAECKYYRFLSSDMIQSKNVSLSSEFAISMIITDI